MNADENRKRIQELRRIGFQKLLAGVVLIFAAGVICFIFLDENADSHSHSGGSYLRGRGLGMVLLAGVFGLWNLVRGVIYLVRAQSGDEQFAKGIEDAVDNYEKKQGLRMGQKIGNGSMHNVLVLLVWVFLIVVFAFLGIISYASFFHYQGVQLIHHNQ